jgi:hypothetical protein
MSRKSITDGDEVKALSGDARFSLSLTHLMSGRVDPNNSAAEMYSTQYQHYSATDRQKNEIAHALDSMNHHHAKQTANRPLKSSKGGGDRHILQTHSPTSMQMANLDEEEEGEDVANINSGRKPRSDRYKTDKPLRTRSPHISNDSSRDGSNNSRSKLMMERAERNASNSHLYYQVKKPTTTTTTATATTMTTTIEKPSEGAKERGAGVSDHAAMPPDHVSAHALVSVVMCDVARSNTEGISITKRAYEISLIGGY